MWVAPSSLLGIVLLLAARAAGAEASAPLEAAKQELRQLESTQKNKAGPAMSDPVKLDTPMLDVGGASNPGMPQWTERKKEDEKRARQAKQRQDENWLVNGVERLGREETAATAGTASGSTEVEVLTNTPDPADPQYLLKLFDEQEKRSAAKETPTRVRPTPAPDPFAPFLQGWLGTSPVRNQVMEQFRKGGDVVGPTAVPGGTAEFRSPVVVDTGPAPLPYETAAAPKANPYLIDSGLPIPTRDGVSGAGPLPTVELTLPGAAPAPATVAPVSPLPDTRTPAKGPPANPADDKKYFPQLNRF